MEDFARFPRKSVAYLRVFTGTMVNNAKMSEQLGLRLTWGHGMAMPNNEDKGDDAIWAAVGEYIKKHRIHLGWTQRTAAENAAVSADTWNALENGRNPQVKDVTLVRIARALGREPQELLDIAEGNAPED